MDLEEREGKEREREGKREGENEREGGGRDGAINSKLWCRVGPESSHTVVVWAFSAVLLQVSSRLPWTENSLLTNPLVRIHLTIDMIWSTGLAPWEAYFSFPCSLTPKFPGLPYISIVNCLEETEPPPIHMPWRAACDHDSLPPTLT